MNAEPTKPYVYQPFGMQDKAHWETKKIYAVGGIGELSVIKGISKELAEKIVHLIEAENKRKVE
jgi:hypothetical protein